MNRRELVSVIALLTAVTIVAVVTVAMVGGEDAPAVITAVLAFAGSSVTGLMAYSKAAETKHTVERHIADNDPTTKEEQ